MTIQSQLSVPKASHRTQLSLSGEAFSKALEATELTKDNADDLVVISADSSTYHLKDQEDSTELKQGESLLPLRFGPLQEAMETIEAKQGWLLAHEPVIKLERNGDARIDFINYGGFVFSADGGYLSHSVNAW